MNKTILIVDDEPVQRRLLQNSVAKMGYKTQLADGGEAALELLQNGSHTKFCLIILDLVMPQIDGMDVLKHLKEIGISCPVIVQTAQGGIEVAVRAMRAGAVDFCIKPIAHERLQVSIQNAIKLGEMETAVQKINKTSNGTFTFDDMIASSSAMERVIKMGKRGAVSNIPILIEGESGVGKEVFARAIQGTSERSGKPFITVNCGALPENLVESILFGHEKGSFTGATANHVGKFKEADGGTLFLDEVGELSLDIQVKLLRAIQEGEIDPIGSKRPIKTNVRLISATNKDMQELVNAGQFREDLYYRLNVFPIQIPALRERMNDIEALVQHFMTRICLEEGCRKLTGISHKALAMLKSYHWPGNVRQLENTIFRAIILCDGDELTVDEFPQIAVAMGDNTYRIERRHTDSPNLAPSYLDEALSPPSLDPHPSFDSLSLFDEQGDMRSLAQIEEHIIRHAISHYDSKMTAVARHLGIGRSTLYRKLKEYSIDSQGSDATAC